MSFVIHPLAVSDASGATMWVNANPWAFLAIVGLLITWLWLRMQRPEPGQRHNSRPTPVTIEELGRMLLRVARSHDYATFQALFLSGHEAQEVLGDGAVAYFEARTPSTVQHCLDQIAEEIPALSVYDGVQATGPDRYSLRVSHDDSAVILVPIGTIVQVGVAWRIFCPDTGLPTHRPDQPPPSI